MAMLSRIGLVFALTALAASIPRPASAAEPVQPDYSPLADPAVPPHATDSAQLARARAAPAPRRTEIRLVRGADGKLHKVCREADRSGIHPDRDAPLPSAGAHR